MPDCGGRFSSVITGAARSAAAGINCKCTITNYAASREMMLKRISSLYAVDATSEFMEHNAK
jgi:hypothetical protein